MKKRSKHTEYFRPKFRKKPGVWGEIFFSLLFVLLSGFLIFTIELNPPDRLLSISGAAEGRSPIYSKGKHLTGFRFSIGDPGMTFTYQQPDPRVEEALMAVERGSRVTVLYAVRADRNPSLWGLEVDGRMLATTEELRHVRSGRLIIFVFMFVVSSTVAAHYIVRAFKARTQ